MKTEAFKRLKFFFFQIAIITPIFIALLVYIKHGIELNQAKKEYRELVQVQEELRSQYEDLLYEEEVLSSPMRIENIAMQKLGFVYPDSITFEDENSMQFSSLDN